ncbi:MAG: HK97 gp10 family phage protein [Clostridia bacterium]|nr:HK97 gp10 family phage protein [Clostridia bacterium]
MTVNVNKKITEKLSSLGSNTDKICKKVVMAGASPIADEIRRNLEANLKDPTYAGLGGVADYGRVKQASYTGDLLKSFGIAPPDVDKNGCINTMVGFSGYDRKGVPNALKARAMESGTSRLKKRPFVRPAVNKTRAKSKKAMEDKFQEEIKIHAL